VPPRVPAGLAAKENARHAAERETARGQPARVSDGQRLTAREVRRRQFVDASGVHVAVTPRYGRAPKGARVLGTGPQNYGPHVTRLGTLGVEGIQAVMTVDGATDTEGFRADVKHLLAPTLTPGDIVVRDTLAAHKAPGIPPALARRGARLRYLPPYSPDLSPIEPCWGKVKTFLRKAKARTREALDRVIPQALATVTATDALSWFAHCGYALQ
jgi:transposase